MLEVDGKLKEGGTSEQDALQMFGVKKDADRLILTFADGTHFGFLNDHCAKSLSKMLEQHPIELECLANTLSLRERIEKAVKASDTVVRVDINLYGNDAAKDEVGHFLSSKKLYLQRPNKFRPGTEYDNPHNIRFPDLTTDELELVPLSNKEKRPVLKSAETLSQTISDVYASLKRADNLEREESDDKIKTELLS